MSVFDDLSLEFKDDCICITHGDGFEISVENLEGFWKFLAEQCAKYDCSSVLIEANAPKRTMDTVGAFTSGVEAAEVAQNLWLALCFYGYEPDETSQLFRDAARNRGANVEFFTDRTGAEAWLRANNPHFD